MMRGVAVVVAGGAGSRMRVTEGGVKTQYLDLGGKPLMYHALAALQRSALVDLIAAVVAPGDEETVRTEIVERFALSKVRAVVAGGKERYHSVYAGLRAVRELLREEMSAAAGAPGSRQAENGTDAGCAEDILVYIQDAARPFLTEEVMRRCHDGAVSAGACVAAMPVKDTIKQADGNGVVTATPDRKTLWAMQTPQTFRLQLVYDAYTKLIAEESEGADLSFVTDDAMVVERHGNGQRILLTEGSYTNIKVTTPEDLQYARVLLQTET